VLFYQFPGLVLFVPWVAQIGYINYSIILMSHLNVPKCIKLMRDQVKTIDINSMVMFAAGGRYHWIRMTRVHSDHRPLAVNIQIITTIKRPAEIETFGSLKQANKYF